jgi:hypothetical protein
MARRLHSALTAITARLDVQIEAPAGAFALSEYVRGEPIMLLHTKNGPRMVSRSGVEGNLQGETVE